MEDYDIMQFLDRVWGDEDCYVDLPSKVGGHWIPFNISWPEDRDLVEARIASCIEDHEDVYFSVTRFASKGRRISDTLPSRWLFADLDKVDPVFLDEEGLQPTIAWESSPGRFQSLWELDRTLRPETLARVNRALSYALGADRSGWDLTQVLRPPGTFNHKYSPKAHVELLWDSSKVYRPQALVKRIRKIEPEHTAGALVAVGGGVAASSLSRTKSRVKLPARARALLRTPAELVVVGERSAKLWEIERLLADAGYDEDEIFKLIWPCAWNKHAEVHTGEQRLRQEIRKAIDRVPATPTPRVRESSNILSTTRTRDSNRQAGTVKGSGADEDDEVRRRVVSPFVDYANFLSTNLEQPRWLIEDIWGAASHGIIGGEPKTSKSTIAMALALSVASGKPFLNQYETSTSGPVIYIQEEIAPWKVQDNLRKLAWYYGLIRKRDVEILDAPRGSIGEHVIRLDFPDYAPLKLLNNYGFDLTDDADREMLEDEIRREQPKLVILDPFYLVSGGINMNQQHEVMPIMQWLMALRYNYDCAVVVVHHWHKAGADSAGRRPGQRLMGSGLLHGWIESALYFEALEPQGDRLCVRMEREFRNVAPRSPLELSLRLGEPGDLDMDVQITKYDLSGQLLSAIAQTPGITLTALAEALGIDRRTARSRAVGAGCVLVGKKVGRGQSYEVYPPGSEAGGGNVVSQREAPRSEKPEARRAGR